MAEAELKIQLGDVMPRVAAVARAGDVVLVGFDRTLEDEEVETLREGFRDFTEMTGVHIGFIEHVTSMTVLRPAPEGE